MSLMEAIIVVKTAEVAYVCATCPVWLLFDLLFIIAIYIFTEV